ncbi:MAG: hypothetical protein DRJ50_02345 [Actinobacteria bacterium]|nr:MAG: hypothetical protein DRJ50_02345 [Actinomycetota bacterium]
MSWAAAISSVVLGVAFLVAGASKIAAAGSWPVQARGLGAPSFAIPFVPWIEVVLGALLVTQVFRDIAALGALVLLTAFTALVMRRLSRGQHPPCACFGAWSSKPIGPGTVARNVFLMVLAVLSLVA